MFLQTVVWHVLLTTILGEALERTQRSPSIPPDELIKPNEKALEQLNADVAYNARQEKCCRGSVYPLTNRVLQKCCGSDTYDVSRQLCCHGVVQSRKPGEACCGQQTYNSDEALCCKGEVVPVTPEDLETGSVDCCGEDAYDRTKEICCKLNGKMKVIADPVGDANACCGDKPINTNKQACCLGDGNDLTTTQVHCHDGNKTLCCGSTLYDPSTQDFCCGGEVYNEGMTCCGGKPYLKTEAICCEDNTFPNPTGSLQCCGSKDTFDPTSEVCCAETMKAGEGQLKIAKIEPEEDRCCGSLSYNSNKQLCCTSSEGIQYLAKKKTPNANRCCEDVAYEIDKGVCCDGIFFEGPLNTLSCCGQQAFNITTGEQFCCNNQLEYVKDGKACCGISQLFNPQNETCCAEFIQKPGAFKVHPTAELNFCCGLELFNVLTHNCCSDVIFKKEEKQYCCGFRVYNSESEACCLNKPVPKMKGQNACCFNGTTDEGPTPWPINPYFGFIP